MALKVTASIEFTSVAFLHVLLFTREYYERGISSRFSFNIETKTSIILCRFKNS